jgi:hypothetical protein
MIVGMSQGFPAESTARARPAQSGQDVLTYHGDVQRTGWNANETQLTVSNVNASSFGLLQTVALDGRVDAQPLVVTQQPIDGQGTHDVVYVATENNTLFAFDAQSGATLWNRNFGLPVPDGFKNGDDNVYPVMGILGTPVVDRTLNAIYVVADTFGGSSDAFTLHAIALNNGSDLVTPVVVQSSTQLKNGSTWNFNSQFQLQRAGLLEANGSIYVTFGSNGDIDPEAARGTVIRYDAATLAPLASGVTDRLVSNQPFYLSSIWQSGYAPAADAAGNVYLSTGNSSYSAPTYNKKFNHPEGVLKLSGDLSALLSSFTPSDYFKLDQYDADLGSGGTLVLPGQPGKFGNLVVAGGKDGREFLLDADDLGGYKKDGPDKVLATVGQGSCWCGPSYFVGSDGVARVVTGGGNGVTTWKIATSSHGKPHLNEDSSTGSGVVNGLPDDGGTFPVISSNAGSAGTAVAWFVQRPQSASDNEPGTPVTLYAYDAMNLSHQLYATQAGTWRHADNSNANIVPTVANGRVYVASERQLQIFGLLSQNKVRR